MSILRTPARRRRGRRSLDRRAVALAAASVAALGTAGGYVATAAPPPFPNNIVVFPDRDFVTIEGYQDHLGQTALVEVTRGAKVIGSAKGVVQAGDVAFEINHPGGYCWGDGTGLAVTPDIRPGDKVEISFAGTPAGDTTVQNAFVTGHAILNGSTMTVKGYIGAGVNPAQMEQRVINPDLVATAIGRRDIRAVPGALTPAATGGYSSSLVVEGDTFTATYIFDDPAIAAIAAGSGGERAMSWQVEDADGNRQGLTIAESGELGGPGMGGCPTGPADQAAPQPGSAWSKRSADSTEVTVGWAPAEAVPGAAAVTGYSITAIAQTKTTGEQVQVGRRVADTLTRTTITGLDPSETYDVEVRSIAGPRISETFPMAASAPAPIGDTTPPTLSASPAPVNGGIVEAAAVKLTSEPNADIYYTTNGTAVIEGGMPTTGARPYTGDIPLSKQTVLNVVAFDRAGNATLLTGTYTPPADTTPTPSAPTGLTGTAGPRSVSLKWAGGDPSITGYGVQAYDAAGGKIGVLEETTATALTINNLAQDVPHYFTVKAKNGSGYGPESAKSGPLTPTKLTDTVGITSARWKTGDFRVVGTLSVPTGIVTVYTAGTNGPDRSKPLGSATVTAAAAPSTGGDYDMRARNGNAPATKPASIYVESNGGGIAGPFLVANG